MGIVNAFCVLRMRADTLDVSEVRWRVWPLDTQYTIVIHQDVAQ